MSLGRTDSTRGKQFITPGYLELVVSVVLVWGIGDTVSTVFAASHVGAGAELNPWMRAMLHYEPLLVVTVKLAAAVYVGLVLVQYRDSVETVPLWRGWLLAIVALGLGVVLNNTYVGLVAVGV